MYQPRRWFVVLPTSFASAFSSFCPFLFSKDRCCCRALSAEEGNLGDNLALKQRPNSPSLFLSILSFLYTIIRFLKNRQNPAPLVSGSSWVLYFSLEILSLIKIKNSCRSHAWSKQHFRLVKLRQSFPLISEDSSGTADSSSKIFWPISLHSPQSGTGDSDTGTWPDDITTSPGSGCTGSTLWAPGRAELHTWVDAAAL